MGEKKSYRGGGEPPTNRRRRLVLSQLQFHGPMTIRDLAEQIAVTDQKRRLESLCEEAINEVEVALHHVHVPKLEQAGYVEYDSRSRIAGLTERGRRLDVNIDCRSVSTDRTNHVSVELCPDTMDRLHDIITHDDRFDGRMSYDAVIGRILADVPLDVEEEEKAK